MILDTFRLQNFRSIQDSGILRLRPVTLLVGPNEAGKSSLLHALAMLKQSLEAADSGAALIENGRLVTLGAYRQLVYRHETSRVVSFKLGLGDGVRAEIDFAYSVRRKSVYLRRFELGEGAAAWLSVSGDGGGRVERVEVAEPAGAPAEPHILGTVVRSRCAYRPVPAWDRWDARAGRPITEFAASPGFYHRCAAGLAALEAMLGRLVFLGPERGPEPIAGHVTANLLPDVGARGENTAALLHAHRYADDAAPGIFYVAERLERLGLAKHMRVVPIEEHLYEITIADPQTGLGMNLSEAGRAVRQLFPLLVQTYLAAPDAALLLEEPESGLHPRLHAAVADLLIEASRSGRRFLVETYSEPILRRLLQQLRDGALPAADLGIYFAQRIDGATQFTEVPVNPDGTLRHWPADFWSDEPRSDL